MPEIRRSPSRQTDKKFFRYERSVSVLSAHKENSVQRNANSVKKIATINASCRFEAARQIYHTHKRDNRKARCLPLFFLKYPKQDQKHCHIDRKNETQPPVFAATTICAFFVAYPTKNGSRKITPEKITTR